MSFRAIAAVSLDGVREAVGCCDLFPPARECRVALTSIIGVGSHVVAPQSRYRDGEGDRETERTEEVGRHVSWGQTRGNAMRNHRALAWRYYHSDGSTLVAVLRPTAQGR